MLQRSEKYDASGESVRRDPLLDRHTPAEVAEARARQREAPGQERVARHLERCPTVADHAIAGTLSGLKGAPRIVMLDDHSVEVPPSRNMLIVRNDDRPGMIAKVTSELADAGINISDMAVGTSPQGESAMQVLITSEPVSQAVVDTINASPGIASAQAVTTD